MTSRQPLVIGIMVCFCLAPVSMLASGVLIWSHLRIRKLRKYPGELVLMQCFLQFIIDSTWFLAFFLVEESDSFFLWTFYGLSSWAYFCSCSYTLILSFEIYSKIKKPFRPASKLRRVLYHVLTLGISLVYFTLLVVNGLSADIVHAVYMVMLLMISASLVLVVHSLHKLKRQNSANYMLYHLFVVVTCIPSFIPIFISSFVSLIGYDIPKYLEAITGFMGSCSGTIIFLARVSEPKMFKQVLRSLVCRKKIRFETLTEDSDIYESIISQEFNPYFSFFEGLQNTNVLKVLTGLNFLFSKRKPLEEYLIKQPNAAFWNFEVLLESKIKYKVKEYFPEPFNILRTTEGISDFDLADSLSIRDNLQDLDQRTTNPGGRSSSFFYFTADKKYIIKTINQQELKTLKNSFGGYFDRVYARDSLISRIQGIFRFKIDRASSLYIILIENTLSGCENPVVFDLKGCSLNRERFQETFSNLESMPRNQVMKDLDFLRNVRVLNFSEDSSKKIFEAIEKDTYMLQSFGIMDYSLLLAIDFSSESLSTSKYLFTTSDSLKVYLAIIDFAQNFNCKKKIENSFKKLFFRRSSRGFSTVPPVPYRERFLDFVKSITGYKRLDNLEIFNY